jgi:hypothetical protein
MYLKGESSNGGEPKELGYWRKHPDLHGFIVREFASGVDECQRIPLTSADIDRIVAAVKVNDLPYTTGFFFGSSDWWSDEESVNQTLECFKRAQAWLKSDPSNRVYYRASW